MKTKNTKMTAIEKLEIWLKDKYEFRYNEVHSRLEFRSLNKQDFEILTDRRLNTILMASKRSGSRTGKSTMMDLLNSDFSPFFHPFKTYFEQLPKWDGKIDYIQQLSKTVKTSNKELWEKCLKKWIVASVKCSVIDNFENGTALIFQGKQGVGKTRWFNKLITPSLEKYVYSGVFDPTNSVHLMNLAQCFYVNMDELEVMNEKGLNSLKHVVTVRTVDLRNALGRLELTAPRRASFLGSVNDHVFLRDTTGNRRWLCFHVIKMEHEHSVDMELVYSQAYALSQSNFRCYFNKEETLELAKHNRAFELMTPEEEFVLKMFRKPIETDIENEVLKLTATEVLAEIMIEFTIIPRLTTIGIGKIFSKHGFRRLKRGKVYSWEVVYAKKMNPFEEMEENEKSEKLHDVLKSIDVFDL